MTESVMDTNTNSFQGMVEPGEHVSQTLKREFGEEALNVKGVDNVKRANISSLFKSGGLEVIFAILKLYLMLLPMK